MDALMITGGRPLTGEIAASGAKNAALPLMAAALLTDAPLTLSNVPQVSDVATLAALLGELGVRVHRPLADTLQLTSEDEQPYRAEKRLVRRMRASVCVLGPLLARRRQAVVARPGGCSIGPRPIDRHLEGLARLGADIQCRQGYVIASARRLQGATVDLSGPRGTTVTGTANILSAASLARGVTMILSAAREPEIVELARLLKQMGARIEGEGTGTIQVRGVEQLGGAAWRLIPDRIEAATYLIAAAATQGSVAVGHIEPDHLLAVLELLDMAGCHVQREAGAVRVEGPRLLKPIHFAARPYPGVPTDLQAPLTVLAACAGGTSHIADTVFPRRFEHVEQLHRMGAAIDRTAGGKITVQGGAPLRGASLTASDLRSCAALIIAGMAASGRTAIHHWHHIKRGYQSPLERLASLGTQLSRAAPAEAMTSASSSIL